MQNPSRFTDASIKGSGMWRERETDGLWWLSQGEIVRQNWAYLSQWLHLNGFAPVCFLKCRVSSSLLAKRHSQPSHEHLYGFSPVNKNTNTFQPAGFDWETFTSLKGMRNSVLCNALKNASVNRMHVYASGHAVYETSLNFNKIPQALKDCGNARYAKSLSLCCVRINSTPNNARHTELVLNAGAL